MVGQRAATVCPGGGVEEAWADQFAMKIIPRLRGLETDASSVRDGLDALEAFVPDVLRDSFERARKQELFAWAGAAEMYRVEET